MRRHKIAISVAVFGAILITGYQNFGSAPANLIPDCSPPKIKEVLEKATPDQLEVSISCNLKLNRQSVITKRLLISGEKSSGVVVDCGGGSLYGGHSDVGSDLIKISSVKSVGPAGIVQWSQPRNVKIKNCNLHGSVHVAGISPNGTEQKLELSNRPPPSEAETSLAAAPVNVSFENLTIYGSRRIYWSEKLELPSSNL